MTKAELIEAMKGFPDDCHVLINTNNNTGQDIRYEETEKLTNVNRLCTDCALLIILSAKGRK